MGWLTDNAGPVLKKLVEALRPLLLDLLKKAILEGMGVPSGAAAAPGDVAKAEKKAKKILSDTLKGL